MIKMIAIINILLASALYSQDFKGCGEYLFKGILKEGTEASPKVIYVVNEGTKSEQKFEIAKKEDLLRLSLFMNMPSSFKGKIMKRMDGTKGVVQDPTEIARRFPDPLSGSDTGISLIKASKCN